MAHMAILSFLWHPLGYCSGTHAQIDACRSYNFWSGIFSDATIFTGFGVVLMAFWRTHNCHVHRCLRLMWHPHPETGHPVCKHHHPHRVHADGIEVRSRPPVEVTQPSGTEQLVSAARAAPPD